MSTENLLADCEIYIPVAEKQAMDMMVGENSTEVLFALLIKKLAKIAAEPMSDARRPVIEAASQLHAYFLSKHIELTDFLARVSEDDAANQAMNRRLVPSKGSSELKYVNGWWSGFGKVAPYITRHTEEEIGMPLASSLWALKLSKLHVPQYINVLMDRIGFLYVKLTLAKNLYAKKEPFMGKLLWSVYDDEIRSFVNDFWTEVVSPDDRFKGKLFNFKQIYEAHHKSPVSNSSSNSKSEVLPKPEPTAMTRNPFELLGNVPVGGQLATVPNKPTKPAAKSRLAGYSDAAKKDLKKTVAKSLDPVLRTVKPTEFRTVKPTEPVPAPSGPSWADITKKHQAQVDQVSDFSDVSDVQIDPKNANVAQMVDINVKPLKRTGFKPKLVAHHEPVAKPNVVVSAPVPDTNQTDQTDLTDVIDLVTDLNVGAMAINDDMVDDHRQESYDYAEHLIDEEMADTVEAGEAGVSESVDLTPDTVDYDADADTRMILVNLANFENGRIVVKPVYMSMSDFQKMQSASAHAISN